jgi:hypothetical protein
VFAAIIALHLALRGTGWMHEWLRTVLMVSFACVFLGPLAAGVGAVEGGRWARSELMRAVDRPHSSTAVRAWGALVAWLVLPIPAALVAAGAIAKVQGLPGLPGPTDLAQLGTAELLMVGWTTVGFAIGWRARAHFVVAPFVTGVAFSATIALWGSRTMIVNTGGTFTSLVGMQVNPWVIRAQATFWVGATVGALALLANRRQLRGATALGCLAVLGMVIGAQWGTRADGLTFARGPADLRCAPIDSGVPLCLAPGYESARGTVATTIEAAFGPWRRNGLPMPKRITQDSEDAGSSVMWIAGSEVLHPRVGDVQSRLAMSLVPPGCDYWNRPRSDRALSLVMGTVITDPLPGEVLPAGATGPDHAAKLRDAIAVLHACAGG